jgi:hypothetical protein
MSSYCEVRYSTGDDAMTPRRSIVLALTVTLAALAGGCGQSTPEGGPVANPVPVSATRSGGLAGVSEAIEVAKDGSWTYTDRRMNTTEHGTLSPAQHQQLLTLVAVPAFAADLAKPAPDPCADAFQYTISLGGDATTFSDCGDNRPAVKAAIAALTEATPF